VNTRTVISLACAAGLIAVSGGCAQLEKNMKSPHPMERNFGHMWFNSATQVYPALKAAAPQNERTPRRDAEAERRTATITPVAAPTTIAKAPAPVAKPTEVKPAPVIAEAPKRPRVTAPPLPTIPARLRAPKATEDRGLHIEEVRPPAKPVAPEKGPLGDGTRAGELLAAAQRLVGIQESFDERGFLTHLLQVADVDIQPKESESLAKALYEKLNEKDRVYGPAHSPVAGDLIFFHNTLDRDKDGRADDWFTMAAVVERSDGDGTVTLIGYARGAIRRMHMNLKHPSIRRNEITNKTHNDLLRAKSMEDRPFTAYLAGELFASYGRL